MFHNVATARLASFDHNARRPSVHSREKASLESSQWAFSLSQSDSWPCMWHFQTKKEAQTTTPNPWRTWPKRHTHRGTPDRMKRDQPLHTSSRSLVFFLRCEYKRPKQTLCAHSPKIMLRLWHHCIFGTNWVTSHTACAQNQTLWRTFVWFVNNGEDVWQVHHYKLLEHILKETIWLAISQLKRSTSGWVKTQKETTHGFFWWSHWTARRNIINLLFRQQRKSESVSIHALCKCLFWNYPSAWLVENFKFCVIFVLVQLRFRQHEDKSLAVSTYVLYVRVRTSCEMNHDTLHFDGHQASTYSTCTILDNFVLFFKTTGPCAFCAWIQTWEITKCNDQRLVVLPSHERHARLQAKTAFACQRREVQCC